MKTHQIGEMCFDEYQEGELPNEAPENPVFSIFPVTMVHAIYLMLDDEMDMVGLVYREHEGGKLLTRVRFRDVATGDKTAVETPFPTPTAAIDGFLTRLQAQFGGRVMTPDRNRGRYCAYCRMLRIKPLERSRP